MSTPTNNIGHQMLINQFKILAKLYPELEDNYNERVNILANKISERYEEIFDEPDTTKSTVFWNTFRSRYYPNLNKITGSQAWHNIPQSVTNLKICHIALVRRTYISCIIWIKDDKALYQKYRDKKDEIEQITGELEWKPRPDSKASSVEIRTSYTTDEAAYEWYQKQIPLFIKAFSQDGMDI